MTWFKVDDQIPDHPKVRRLGRDKLPAVGLWTVCGAWAGGALSDGFVPAEIVRRFDPRERYAARLVEVGMWDRDQQFGEDGYRFHDWEEFQPSRSQVHRQRKATKDRVARWRKDHQSPDGNGVTGVEHQHDRNGDSNGVTNSVSNGSGNAPPDPTRPVPVLKAQPQVQETYG